MVATYTRVTNPAGAAMRITGAGVLAALYRDDVVAGRLYSYGFTVYRNHSAGDPANDGVRCGVAWSDKDKVPLTGADAVSYFDITDLDEGELRSGVRTASTLAGADWRIPAAARYGTRFVQTFGSAETQTDAVELSRSGGTAGSGGAVGPFNRWGRGTLSGLHAFDAETVGFAYFVTDDGSGGIYFVHGSTPGEWFGPFPIRGLVGPAGADGVVTDVKFGFETLADLEAVTDQDPNTAALVLADPDDDNNGYWLWNGIAWLLATHAVILQRATSGEAIQNRNDRQITPESGRALIERRYGQRSDGRRGSRRLVFGVGDGKGNPVFAVTERHIPISTGCPGAANWRFDGRGPAGAVFAICDPKGNPGFIFNSDRSVTGLTGGAGGSGLRNDLPGESDEYLDLYPAAQVLGLVLYGQSNTLGFFDGTVLSSAIAYADMFVGGLKTHNFAGGLVAGRASLVALQEQLTGGGNEEGETPVTGMLRMVRQRLAAIAREDQVASLRRFFASAPGGPGLTAAELASGSSYFDTLLSGDITIAYTREHALGRSMTFPAVAVMQGPTYAEEATDPEDYKATWQDIRADLQTLVRATTGRSTLLLPLVMSQPCTHVSMTAAGGDSIANAIRELHDEDALIACVAPETMQTYRDTAHFIPDSDMWAGAYVGLAIAEWLILGCKPRPLRPLPQAAWQIEGNLCTIPFDVEYGSLTPATDWLAPADFYGIDVRNGSDESVITGAAIVGNRELQLTASEAFDAGFHFIGGGEQCGDGVGPQNGPRVVLRDQRGDDITFSVAGSVKPMHNFGLLFHEVLT